jgi:membrane-associated phospholipid phosphatase
MAPMKLRRSPRQTLDRRLFGALNRLPHTKYLDEQITLLSDLGKGMGWAAGAAWLAYRDGSRGRRAALASVSGMLAAVALVQGPVKASFPRNRPSFRHEKVAVVVGQQPLDTSFPSGHTAGSFAAAVALSSFYAKDRPLLLLLASAVGVSRVYLGHHFPSDVLVGASAGAAIGWMASGLAHLRTPSEPSAG